MKNMKKVLLSFIIVSIIVTPILSNVTHAKVIDMEKDNVDVVTYMYYSNGAVKNVIVHVSPTEAEEIQSHLIKLNKFLVEGNRDDAISQIIFLKNRGILKGDAELLYSLMVNNYVGKKVTMLSGNANISNYLCYVNAVGNGVIIFTIGHLLFMLAKMGFVSPSLRAYMVILILTHLVPFRVALPILFTYLEDGSVSITGLNGHIHKMATENASAAFTLVGFTGVTINIPFGNSKFLFVSGVSAFVTDRNVFNYHN